MTYYCFAVDDCCTGCLECEADNMLPGFVSKWNGKGYVSNKHFDDEEIQLRIDRAIMACPTGCITIEPT